eukprot:4422080-Pyramimonas_sp.AAC.1
MTVERSTVPASTTTMTTKRLWRLRARKYSRFDRLDSSYATANKPSHHWKQSIRDAGIVLGLSTVNTSFPSHVQGTRPA